jgi:hypothetical protein
MYSSKELNNIPISISLLHEQEYNNLCILLKPVKGKCKKRRVYSERSSDKETDELNLNKLFTTRRRKTLKN